MRWFVVLAAVGSSLVFAATPVAGASDAVHVAATIDGQELASASSEDPVVLDPDTPARVRVNVTNDSSDPVDIGGIDVTGHVLGLTFFSYQTAVEATVAPGETRSLEYALDMSDLENQATGLINGTVAVRDENRTTLGEISTVTDVRGSLFSVYGLFGLALAILTALALLDAVLAIARHRLPENRWRRALRMLTPGIGIGLVLAFTLSATRVWVPTTSRWLLLAAVFAVVFFLLGYLSPAPDSKEDEFDEDLDALDEEMRGDQAQGVDAVRRPPDAGPTGAGRTTT